MSPLKPLALAVSGLFAFSSASAAEVVQKVKPPVSQAYIDLATFTGGAPSPAAGMAGMGGVTGMLGGLFGGGVGAAKNAERGNTFGQTQGQGQGRWMDVTLLTRENPKLKAATQAVPAGSKLAPSLNLQAPELEKPGGDGNMEQVTGMGDNNMPKGKMYLYWGCGAEVRKGQPLVLDLAKMDPAQYSKFFQNRSATQHLPAPAPGRPAWPNKADDRLLPEGASVAGEHAFSGEGLPEGFKFNIDGAHDLMPAVEANRSDSAGGVLFKWKAMPQATGWFVQAMGMRDPAAAGEGEIEMVYWSSSELPDMGMGLINYQPDSAIAKWQKEKVILPASATECVAPKEAVSAMAMLHVIAYGDELNMAYPPRPKDPKVTWEPQWDVKVRRKSVASLMPGMSAMNAAMGGGEAGSAPVAAKQPQQAKAAQDGTNEAVEAVKKSAFDVFKNVLQRKAEEVLSR
ncbi:hypothetical protein GCM10027321_28890 [Massilia terrae]|uniref:Uncharacterized protein n=1 Tax=Massilia terrae TaxID=1811224 RepID=A0ABT2D0I7_9BURK|nr:hypothetical protein [Massilia terrae]MCS0659715.1 hypothetical protein [Massilia terrae]